MSNLWTIASGEVPGGFSLFLVVLIGSLLILEYVYRVGQTMPRPRYLRWRWRLPIIILGLYALVWIQTPPKLAPLRIALINADSTGQASWQHEARVDLTTRRLRRTLPKALINPWAGATNYPEPGPDALQKAHYQVYSLSWDSNQQRCSISIVKGSQQTFEVVDASQVSTSADIARFVLADLKKQNSLAEAFQQNYSSDVLISYYCGLTALRSQHPDTARVFFDLALAKEAAFTPAQIGVARCAELKGDHASAQQTFIAAAQQDDNSNESLLALAEFYLRCYEWETAEAALKVVLSRDPNAVRALVGLARLHPERLKDLRLNTPTKLLHEAVRLDPAYEPARVLYADQLLDQGYPSDARKILQTGLKINSTSPELLLKLGAVELFNSQPELARATYEQILSHDPQNKIARFNLGVVNYRTWRYDEALENFRQVEFLDGPKDGLYYLGLIYQMRGEKDQALHYFQKRWDQRTGENDGFALKARNYLIELGGQLETQRK